MAKKQVNRDRLLKFHGKFTDLIPYGFSFQKLFASNYRQYCLDVTKHIEDIRVWQHHGGYVEFNDWYSASRQVLNALYNKDFKWMIKDFSGGRVCVFNMQTGFIEEYNEPLHDSMSVFIRMEDNGMSDHEIKEAMKHFHSTYREIVVSAEMLCEIRKLVNKGWIVPDAMTVTPLILSTKETMFEMVARMKKGGKLTLDIA